MVWRANDLSAFSWEKIHSERCVLTAINAEYSSREGAGHSDANVILGVCLFGGLITLGSELSQ